MSSRDERPDWARRLTLARERTGPNASQFVHCLGMSRQRYGMYEKGIREPSIEAWRRIVGELVVASQYMSAGD